MSYYHYCVVVSLHMMNSRETFADIHTRNVLTNVLINCDNKLVNGKVRRIVRYYDIST